MDRTKATQLLQRVVAEIEAGSFPAKVKEFYVFGSYARGAPSPGDLDVILVHDPPDPELLKRIEAAIVKKYGSHNILAKPATWPERKFEMMMRKVIQRPGEKMDILLGLSLNKVLSDHGTIASSARILIWSESDREWQPKLDSMKIDETAGRYDRGHFAELRRFNSDVSMMKTISQAINKRLLILTKVDCARVVPELNPIYQYWYDHWVKCEVMGSDSMKLLKHGMWWMQQQAGQDSQRPMPPRGHNRMVSENFEYEVYFGRPPLHVLYGFADNTRRRVRICLLPHFRRGQPHEMFIFEPGPEYSANALNKIRGELDIG